MSADILNSEAEKGSLMNKLSFSVLDLGNLIG
jgi:hypothetical protein